jgi:hypothetical protein
MAEVAGKTNQVWWLSGAVAIANNTGAKVLAVDNSSYQMLCDLLEITEFGDSYKNRMAGLLDTSMTVSGNYYPGDTTGQDVLLVPGTTGFLGIYPSGTTVAGKQFQCIVESAEIGADVGGKQTFSATVQGIALPVELPLRP